MKTTPTTLSTLLLAFLLTAPAVLLPVVGAAGLETAAPPLSTPPTPPLSDAPGDDAPSAYAAPPPSSLAGDWTKAEGWALEDHRILGRISATFDSWASEAWAGTFRLGQTHYHVNATRDETTWNDRPAELPRIVRYVGSATDTNGTHYALLIDHVPSQAYASGYFETLGAEGVAPERVSFHLFDNPASAILALPNLLPKKPPVEVDSASLPSLSSTAETDPLPLPLVPQDGIIAAPPQVQVGGADLTAPLDNLTPTVPWESVPAPVVTAIGLLDAPTVGINPEDYVPQPMQTSGGDGLGGGGTSGGSDISAGDAENNGCQSNCGGGPPACSDGVDNDGDTLVDMNDPGCTSTSDTDESNVAPQPNVPPDTPTQPAGPVSVFTNQSASYQATACDPNGDFVEILYDWGDNTPPTWSAAGTCGRSASHAWRNPGYYYVRALAREATPQRLTSSWGPSLQVEVKPSPADLSTDPVFGLLGIPLTAPMTPEAPAISKAKPAVGESVGFTVSTMEPSQGKVRFEFWWDDRTVSWSDWVFSGQSTTVNHAWNTTGTKNVYVRAVNMQGGESEWSPPKTFTVYATPTFSNPPTTPAAPTGWSEIPRGSEGRYEARATDPDGDNVRYEFDWGDGTTTFTGYVTSGTPAGTGKTWIEGDTYNVRVRAQDVHGTRSQWSPPLPVRVGDEPFEFILTDLEVSNPTPTAIDPTDPEGSLNARVTISAWIENRAAAPLDVDFTLYDYNVPVCTRMELVRNTEKKAVSCTYETPGALGTGSRQLRAVVDDLNKYQEVNETNNNLYKEIRVRNMASSAVEYGAHYDGLGPQNPIGHQLAVGLYEEYRTPDTNTYDELDGTPRPMRLALWSENLVSTNQTWYFTDNVQATIQSAAALGSAYPTGVNQTVSAQIPVGIGYSSRAASPDNAVTIQYNTTEGSWTSATSSQAQWNVKTGRTPVTKNEAIGFLFTAASTAGWSDFTFSVRYDYIHIERQAGKLFLWHETLHAGNVPIRSSSQGVSHDPQQPYAPGTDYNLGDRSMTSSPTWDVSADSRRAYFDGITDKSPQSRDGVDSRSSAYMWFRLDGPLYRSHDVRFEWWGPHNNYAAPFTCGGCVFTVHYAGPEERGELGSADEWVMFRQPLIFDAQTLGDAWKGTWHVRIYVDGQPTAQQSFHIMATSNERAGPEETTDEELQGRINEQEGAVSGASPSNEDLPELDPTNRMYLEQKRVDGYVDAGTERIDDTIGDYISGYLLDQARQVQDIAFDTADPILPDMVRDTVEPILYDVADVLRDPPSTNRVGKTVTRTVWNVTNAILASCGLNLVRTDVDELASVPDDATACVTQVVEAVLAAAPLLNETTNTTLGLVGSTLSTLTTTLGYATNITGQALNDPLAIIENATAPVNSILEGATQGLPDVVPRPPAPPNLNPKNLADNLGLVYDAIMQAGPNPNGAKETAISTADSLFYNLHVTNEDGSKSWTFYNVALGNATTINVDENAATGIDGQDLLMTATLTPAQGSAQTPPTDASRSAPTLRIQALSSPARSMPLLACAFHQLPGVSYVAATCVDTRNATLASLGAPTPGTGFPATANVTLSGYAFKANEPNVTASLRLESQGLTQPILASGSIFQVDLLQHTKPRVAEGDHADAILYSTTGQGDTEFTLRRTSQPSSGATSEWSWTTTGASNVLGSYSLSRGDRVLVASSNATNPPAKLEFKAARNAADSALDVTTQTLPPAQLGRTTFALKDAAGASLGEAFSLEANALPASLGVHADDLAGTLTVTSQGGAANGLKIVSTNNRASCPASTIPDQLTRQPVDGNGGACLSLRLSTPIQALSVSLASEGPNLALASQARSSAPLAILVRPGSQTTRSLDMLVSSTPLSATLQSSLAQADGSTSLSWTASESLDQARVIAKSGNTLLHWNATTAPTTAQATYQWSADTVTIRTSEPNLGTLEFLLTNTGTAPTQLPGDYIAGTHTGTSGGALSAAARLSGIHEAQGSLGTPNFRLDVAGSAGEPFGIRYKRAALPAFTLDANPLPLGGFSLASVVNEGATHRIEYASDGPGGTLAWVARASDGTHLEATLADVPAAFTVTTAPSSGTFSLDTGGDRAGLFSVTHAPSGANVATLGGVDVVHLQSTAGGADVYRASLRDVRGLTLAKSPGSLVVTSAQTAEHPLRVHVGNAAKFLTATTSVLPSSVTLTYGRTGLSYSASASTPPQLDLRVMEDGNVFGFTGRTMPTQAGLAWASSTQVSNLSVSHNAANVGLLHLEGNFAPAQGGSGNEFVRIHLEDAPPQVVAGFNRGTDEITLSAGPTRARVVEFQHAASSQSIQIPTEPNHILMKRASADASGPGAFEAMRLENVTTTTLRLGSGAGQPNRLRVEASSPSGFYAEYATTTGASLAARYSNLPSRTDLEYALVTSQNNTTAGGFRLVQQNGASINTLRLHAEQAGFALDVDASTAPSEWSGTWAPSQALEVRAKTPLQLRALAYRPTAQAPPTIPNAAAFALVDNTNAQAPQVGVSFPAGVTLVRSGIMERELQISQASGHASLSIIHKDAGTTNTLRAVSPSASFTLRAPPTDGATTLGWTASGPTGTLVWGLDAPNARWRWNATTLPSLVTLRFDPVLGTFTTNAPGGAGAEFTVQYARDPTQSFYGSEEGLVLLVSPTGPENYPAGVTTFTLDLPYAISAAATFTGTQGSVGAFGASLRRSPGAVGSDVALALAAGPEALRFEAQRFARVLDTSWIATAQDGFRGTVTTDATLENVLATYRGKDGIANVTVATVASGLNVRLSPNEGATAGEKRAILDYGNGASSSSAVLFLDAAGALANLTLQSAPREFHAQAPLACASTGASGRAWVANGESAGHAHLVLVPRDKPNVPAVEEAQRLLATCDPNVATIQLDFANFRTADWSATPATGALSASITSAAADAPARFILTANANDYVLDGLAASLPATLTVSGSAPANMTRASWDASASTAWADLVYQAPGGFVDALLAAVPASWSLLADSAAATPLVYAASGPAGSLRADIEAPGFGAHVDAADVPRSIAWTVPYAACPAPTSPLDGVVSTLGSGSVGRLTAWTLPGPAGEFVDDGAGEHAVLTCDDTGATTAVNLTGVEQITWTRALSEILPTTQALMGPLAAPLTSGSQETAPAVFGPPSLESLPNLADSTSSPTEANALQLPSPAPLGPPMVLPAGLRAPISPALPDPLATSGSSALSLPGVEPAAPQSPTWSAPLALPSWPTTTAASGPLAAQTRSVGIVTDPAKSSATAGRSLRFNDLDAQSVNATVDAPSSDVLVSFTMAQGVVVTGLSRDATMPPRVDAWHRAGESVSRALFLDPAGSGSLTLDATGRDLIVNYDGSGPAGGVSVNTAASGPLVVLDMIGGVPSRVTGSIAGRGVAAPECAGLSDFGARFDTGNSGTVNSFVAKVGDAGAIPRLMTGAGAVYACPKGQGPSFNASLSGLRELDLTGDQCAKSFVAPADSLRENEIRMQTPLFDAQLKMRMAPQTIALITATIGNGGFEVRALDQFQQPNPNAVLQHLNVTYEKKDASTPAGGESISCLAFGKNPVRNLFLDAKDLKASIIGKMGADASARNMMRVTGGGTDSAKFEIITDPSEAPEEPPQEPAEGTASGFGLNLSVEFPVGDRALVKYTEVNKRPPTAPEGEADGNYAVIASGAAIAGGNIQVRSFKNASFVLDLKASGTTIDANGTLSYRSDDPLAAPLAVILMSADQSRIETRVGSLPTSIDATLNVRVEDMWKTNAQLLYRASQRTSLSLTSIDSAMLVRWLAATPSLPADVELALNSGPDENDDPRALFHYLSTDGVLPLTLYFKDASAATTLIDIDALRSRIDGSFTATTCGFKADASLSESVDRITFVRTPGTTQESEDEASSPPRRTPGCPEKTASTEASEEDETPEAETTFAVTVTGIPGGTLALDAKTGSAGSLTFTSSGGAIGSILANIDTKSSQGVSRIIVTAQGVILRAANWDIDGDTRYEENPNYIYLSTGGAAIGHLVIDVGLPDKTIYFDSNGRVILGKDADNGFQVRWYTRVVAVNDPMFNVIPFGTAEAEKLEQAGCMKLLDDNAALKSSKHSGLVTKAYTFLKGKEWGDC